MVITVEQFEFNPWKHHLGFICNKLLNNAQKKDEDRNSVVDAIKSINANFVDVYTGKLSENEIKEHLSLQLKERNIHRDTEFQLWLGEKGYQIITLHDGSNWILRKSEYKSAFIHIHPSRIPPLAVRVHGNAWKTVISLLVMFPEYLHSAPSLESINRFRKEFMNLSPVKGNSNILRVMRVYEMIIKI